MEKNLTFRGWFYFRTGWATYFAFIVVAVNALTVTFFLAIEKYPLLSVIFPTFFHYVVIVVGIGVPLLILWDMFTTRDLNLSEQNKIF